MKFYLKETFIFVYKCMKELKTQLHIYPATTISVYFADFGTTAF